MNKTNKPSAKSQKTATTAESATEEFQHLKLTDLQPDPDQPRKSFDAASMDELTQSIRERGVDTPILVCPLPNKPGKYRIVFGERRWRASKAAGRPTIPARIRVMTEAQIAEAQLVENAQRADMLPMEEAHAFDNLRAKFGYTIDELVLKSGKSEKLVRQRLRLMSLPAAAQTALQEGKLRLGVANAIVWIDNEADRAAATHTILTDTWNGYRHDVHAAEEYIRREFLLQLSKAPFSTRDAKLVESAGSCVNCHKRTGATGALFADLGIKDSCLDRTCYQQKQEAHRLVQIEKQRGKATVLDEEITKKVFRYGQDSVDKSAGFFDINERVYADKNHRTWKELIGEEAPIHVAVNKSGKAFQLIPQAEAIRLAKSVSNVDLTPTKVGRGAGNSDALARKKAKARVAALNEFMVSLCAYVEVIARDKFTEAALPLFLTLTKLALKNAPHNSCQFMAKRRELEAPKGSFGSPDYAGALLTALNQIPDVAGVLAFLMEMTVLESMQYFTPAGSTGDFKSYDLQLELGNLIGFDLKQSVHDFTKQFTEAPRAAKAKSAKSKAAVTSVEV